MHSIIVLFYCTLPSLYGKLQRSFEKEETQTYLLLLYYVLCMRNPRIRDSFARAPIKGSWSLVITLLFSSTKRFFQHFATNLQIAASKMSKAELVKALPELLKQGMEVYKSLKDDMSRALGLKKYAEHLSNIVQTFKEVNKYLDESEKAIMEKLTTAHARAQEGMDKAAVVVTVIKEQSGALVSVLDPSAVGTDQEKMWAACQYFSSFAKEMEEKVKEAEDALREASNILQGARNELLAIVNTLKRVQDQFVKEKKEAQAAARAEAYGGAAAGLIFGPIGLIISYSIAAGVTEGLSIPNIEKDFQAQRDTISGYIKGFEDMSAETKALQEKLDAKRKQLIDIHGKLSTTGSLAGIQVRSIAVLHFNLVRKNAQALVEACEKFLANI